MNIAAVKWMTQQKAGDATAKALLFWLAWHLNDETGLCYPSLSTLQKEMEVGSVNTVRSAIEKLTQAGVVHAIAERSKGGKIVRTCYRLAGYPAAKADGSDFELSNADGSNIEVSNNDSSNSDISNSGGVLYQKLTDVVSKIDSNSKKERKEESIKAQAAASAPAPSPVAHSKKPGGKSRTMPLAEAVTTLPDEWRQYAEQVRPEIDPEQMFAAFRFYFTDGKGADKRRSVKGWSSSWQGWVRRETATEANRARPRQKTPEEKRAYQMNAAIASGYPPEFAEAGMEMRYGGIEGDAAALDAVRATLNEEPA
jgi:hypothetical protein